MKTIGYPNNDKAFYLDRLRGHRIADTLIRGTGYQGNGDGHGCFIGCSLHEYDHRKWSEVFGVCGQIAHLCDWLHENHPGWKPGRDVPSLAERIAEAIPQGADTSMVYPQLQVRMQTRNLARIGDGDEPWRVQCREAVQRVIDLWSGGWPDASAAESAESAWSAARSARSSAWSSEIVRIADDLIELLASCR
jgi:hypothetical protein